MTKRTWLSRDSLEDGSLETEVDVWESQPTRYPGRGKRFEWLDGAHVDRITRAECIKRYRVAPDTVSELICVGVRLDSEGDPDARNTQAH